MRSVTLPRASGGAQSGVAAGALPPHSIIISPARSRIEPIPRDQWPVWAKVIAGRRREGDVGIGDTVVHLIGDARSERFKKWFARKFGRDCGCANRQTWLNQRFPY